MPFNKFFLVILFFAIVLTGCFEIPDYPATPEIEFTKITSEPRLEQQTGAYKDSVVISISYKDGDGDLGYMQWEMDSLSKLSTGYNFLVKQLRRVNGKYVEYKPEESLSGYFQHISPDKPGPIEGVIHYSGVQIFHSFYPFARDTVKFEIYIKDRAGNISNTITTDSVLVRTL